MQMMCKVDKNLLINKISVDITYQCPLRCKHCFAESEKITYFNEKSVTPMDWEQAGQKLLELERIFEVKEFSLAGGEPLYAQDKLSTLMGQLANRKQAMCYILSSGIRAIEDYTMLRNVDTFFVSLHYSERTKQNAFAVNPYSFDQAMETIWGLVSHNVKTSITMIAMNRSLSEIIPMYQVAFLLGCDALYINKVILSGRAQAELMLSKSESEQIKAVAMALSEKEEYRSGPKIKINGFVSKKNNLHFQLEIMPDLSIGLRINGIDSMIHIIANLKEDIPAILKKINYNVKNIQPKIRDNQILGGNDGFQFESTYYQ